MEKDKILSVNETAKFLGTSRQLLYKLVKEGRIPGIKLGNRYKFSYRAVLEVIRKGEIPPKIKPSRALLDTGDNLTPAQAGKLISKTRQAVIGYIKAGKLNAIRLPGGGARKRYIIIKQDFENFCQHEGYKHRTR